MPPSKVRPPAGHRRAESDGFNVNNSLPGGARVPGSSNRSAIYGSSTVGRHRSTNAELAELDKMIFEICEQDHPLSVRGVFYRAVALGGVPKTKPGYRKIGREVLKLRRAGHLPYAWITDGTRWQIKRPSWNDPEEALWDWASSYRKSLWVDQDVYIEVWSEKDAINGIISPITSKWDVPLMVARGYSSETFVWNIAQDIRVVDRPTIIYQLGDHDWDGVKAWNDIQRKLREFAPDAEIEFERLAVTPEHLAQYSHFTREPVGKHADVGPSMDVDAIPSPILRQIVNDAIEQWTDRHELEVIKMIEEQEREGLRALAEGWQS